VPAAFDFNSLICYKNFVVNKEGKMKKYFLAVVTLSLIFTVSCVSVNATRIGTAPVRPPIPAEQVVIYRTADQVPSKYEEIALLNAKGESSWTTESGMYEAMKKKAGQLGANAIILDAVSEPSAGAKIAGAFLGTGAERKGKAIAIFIFPKE
jgi:hypothetical protein